MKVLITGVPGWLSTRFVEMVRDDYKKDWELRCLVLPHSNVSGLKKHDVEIVEGDLTKPDTLKTVCKDIEVVFHIAGIIHEQIKTLFQVNTYGTINLLEKCKEAKVRRFIHISSNSPAGCHRHSNKIMTEEDPPAPYMGYGQSKYLAEQFIQGCFHNKELETVILRPCWYYGVRQPARQTRFFKMIKAGNPIFFGSGWNLRSMSYLDNLIQGMILAAEKDEAVGQLFWITDARPYTTLEIYWTIARLLGVELKPRIIPGFVSTACSYVDGLIQSLGFYEQNIHVAGEMAASIACSIEKAKKVLGYEPQVGLEEGMRRSIEWCRENGIDI